MPNLRSIYDSASRESIGGFLLRRVRELGVTHVFGVAGDYNLELLEQLEGTDGLEWVGCCNELNAAYAADGYARTRGLSVLITTYGVGELSALCGVAGAYSEHVPVVSIVGAPPLSEMERRGLLHHTAGDGDYSNMMACGREFSAAQARITPENAASEIDRCLQTALWMKKPVYLQLPSDLAYLEIETPAISLVITYSSDLAMLQEFVPSAKQRIDDAKTVAILIDADVVRYGQQEKVRQLARKLGCPIAVMATAKGAIDETDPSYAGLYEGAFSTEETRQAIECAECLIEVSVRLIDSTTGAFSQRLQPKYSIKINAWNAQVDSDRFMGVYMGDVLDQFLALTDSRVSYKRERLKAAPAFPPAVLSQAWFWKRMESFLREGDVVIAENGTSLSGVLGLTLPAKATVILQALWGAIGYSLPAAFGSLIAAPQRRHVLFIGDGSFQLTAQELSSILRHKLTPVIFLINNGGYTIERLILGENSSYNDIQPWNYASLCDVFANGADFDSRRVSSIDELEFALHAAETHQKVAFIEVMMGRMDAPEALRKLSPIYAKQDYGRGWLSRTAAPAIDGKEK